MTSRSSVCVVVEELELRLPSQSVGVTGLRPRGVGEGGAGNGSQVLTASKLTVLRLISLTAALAEDMQVSASMCERSGGPALTLTLECAHEDIVTRNARYMDYSVHHVRYR